MLWLFFVKTIKSHTVAVCNSVSADGKSVTIYAATYHSSGVPTGGLRLTAPGDATYTEYLFTGYQTDVNTGEPPYVFISNHPDIVYIFSEYTKTQTNESKLNLNKTK